MKRWYYVRSVNVHDFDSSHIFRGFARLSDPVFCHTADGLDIWGR
jgi:hypothetical protein